MSVDLQDCEIIRSKLRKSISLQIKFGVLTIRAPISVDDAYIREVLRKKQSWIKEKLSLDRQKYLLRKNNLSNKNNYLFNGKAIEVSLLQAKKNSVKLVNEILTIELSNVNNDRLAAKVLTKWFADQTLNLVKNRCALYSLAMNLYPKEVLVKSYKARWGCCKSGKILVFNQLLCMAPLAIVDAVVVHELAHLKYLNHSADFWALVYQFCPHYKEANDWLSYHKYQLYIA